MAEIFPTSLSKSNLPVAVDVMGGDRGLGVQVEGAVQAFKEFGVISIMVGPEQNIKSQLASLGATDFPLQIKHAPEVITMEESPARAVRKKANSSLCVAYQLVNSGQASSIISSGNSGAMMVAGRIICGLLPGIERPAITALIPVVGNRKPNVVLDVGANVECNATHLIQFAIMGSVYHITLFNTSRPRVALLSNGSEVSKGTDVIRSAATALSSIKSVNYIGYVEGRDVPTTKAEVIVCDGFVGNVMLKSMEGAAHLIGAQLRYKAQLNWLNGLKFMLTQNIYKDVFYKDFDYTAHGGAPLLGLQRIAVVLHGSSDARAVKNGIRAADSFAKKNLVERLANELVAIDEFHNSDVDGRLFSSILGDEALEGEEDGEEKTASSSKFRRGRELDNE
ncbi:MAG: phosphate acyltransferase PlsX [Deltaproteobacteria bacterium]|nr:phosphate acyltransferase PlsX [Deltaproteobacteria bacterium]